MMSTKDQVEAIMPTLDVGETRAANHQLCADGKRRLYVTRPVSDPTIALYFCHNCQTSGKVEDDAGLRSQWTAVSGRQWEAVDTADNFDVNIILSRCVEDWDYLPPVVHAYAYSNRLTNEDWRVLGLRYDPSTNKVVFPMEEDVEVSAPNGKVDYCIGSRVKGIQYRRLIGTAGPKWVTSKEKDWTAGTLFVPLGPDYNPPVYNALVVVEDKLSAWRIARLPATWKNNIAVMCNYGVQPKPEIFLPLKGRVKHTAVWFDNDNEIVKEKAQNTARTAQLVTNAEGSTVITYQDDPKNCMDSRLEKELSALWTQ